MGALSSNDTLYVSIEWRYPYTLCTIVWDVPSSFLFEQWYSDAGARLLQTAYTKQTHEVGRQSSDWGWPLHADEIDLGGSGLGPLFGQRR